MTTGSNVTDFLAQGVAASRPSAPNAQTGTLSFYYATDTKVLSFYDWNAAAWVNLPTGGAIEYVIDGGGATITTGMKGYLEVPFDCTINSNTLLGDQSGSIVVNIYKCTFAQFDAGATHPVAADKITASAPPTISTATKSQDATLTGWTTALTKGDILAFNVDSVTSIQRVTLSLKVTKT